MFDCSSNTLRKSFEAVLEDPRAYIADVCFTFPENGSELWAHRAFLTVRIPEQFRKAYLPQLDESLASKPLLRIQHFNTTVPFSILKPLLRFWYTAEFGPSTSRADDGTTFVRQEIAAQETKLGMNLLPISENNNDYELLVQDLCRMRNQQINTDVTVQIPAENQGHNPEKIPLHRFVLAARSTYFHDMFCKQFSEASNAIVPLPADIFSMATLEVIIHYLYTDSISIPFTPPRTSKDGLAKKKNDLRVLQRTFRPAEYIGHDDDLCRAALIEMATICHQFKCNCHDCATVLPSMLSFADRNADAYPELRTALIDLYAAKKSLQKLWVQKTFAILVESFISSTRSVQDLDDDDGDEESSNTLISEMTNTVLSNLKKQDAIDFLHDIHLCLSAIRSLDPSPTWSLVTLDLINSMLNHAVSVVSNHFDFYCSEYPVLPSCIEMIGSVYSVDFLEFILTHVLEKGICDENAGSLYQGIVRDMFGRQKIVKNPAVDKVLDEARQKCIKYIKNRWVEVKACGGCDTLDEDTLRQLAKDIDIPQRSLANPNQHDLSAVFNLRSIFSWKPRVKWENNKQKKIESESNNNSNKLRRRLSLRSIRSISGGMMRRTVSWSSTEYNLHLKRTQSLSSDPTPFIAETDTYMADAAKDPSPVVVQQRQQKKPRYPKALMYQGSSSSLTDALLPIDNSESPDKASDEQPPTRQSRLKFQLPVTPARTKSYPAGTPSQRSRTTNRFRWSKNSSILNVEPPPLAEGNKVQLIRRPLPTYGTIKYIGAVKSMSGVWAGVELEHRLGTNDGSKDGERYFHTDPQRGVFVKLNDLRAVLPAKTSRS